MGRHAIPLPWDDATVDTRTLRRVEHPTGAVYVPVVNVFAVVVDRLDTPLRWGSGAIWTSTSWDEATMKAAQDLQWRVVVLQ